MLITNLDLLVEPNVRRRIVASVVKLNVRRGIVAGVAGCA